MRPELTPEQREARRGFRDYVQAKIAPQAGEWDRAGGVPPEAIEDFRRQGYLGSPLPKELGGGGLDMVTYGLLTEEVGKGCSSMRSLLTVHDMVSLTVHRRGGDELKETYLPRLATGELQGALALSEPNRGSDAAHVETTARKDGDEYVLTGRKKWITFGQTADVFLALTRVDGKPTAFLVPADAPGFSRKPISSMTGTRASLLAELFFDECRVPASHRMAPEGFGLSRVVSECLTFGRYTVAWGAVGIAQACLDASLAYTQEREQYGEKIIEHQLVRRLLTEMIADTRAARLLCYRAGYLLESGLLEATPEVMVAKYFASRAATKAANHAIQLHGANGLSDEYPLERHLRDARVTEIIEGSTQIQQITIPGMHLQEL